MPNLINTSPNTGSTLIQQLQNQGNALNDVFTPQQGADFSGQGQQYNQMFGAEGQAVQQQADLAAQQSQQVASAQKEQAQSALASRGLGQGVFGQNAIAPVLERNMFNTTMAELNAQTALPDHRKIRIAQIRADIASKSMTQNAREFQKQFQVFQKDFDDYQQTAEGKLSEEAQSRADLFKRQYQSTVAKLEQTLSGSVSFGGLLGQGLGSLIGGVAGFAATGNPLLAFQFASAGGKLGRGVGQRFGVSSVQDDLRNYIQGF